MFDEFFIKKTPRLVMRAYNSQDYPVWKDTLSSLPAGKNRWDLGPRPLDQLTKAKFQQHLSMQRKLREEDKFYELIAFEKDSGHIIGFTMLMDISRMIFQNAYLGYAVLPSYWRNGYGKEIVKATLEIAFKTLKLHRVEAGIEPQNRKSLALAKSLNFRREGLSQRRLLVDKEWRDIAIYAITAEECRPKNSVTQTIRIRRS